MFSEISEISVELNTVEDAERAFEYYCTKEKKINAELKNFIEKHDHQESKVLSLQKMLPQLQLVHSDSVQLSSMIAFTSALAENVSSKVKQLDVTRIRVTECMQRVEDILDLKFCTDGVQTALQNEDYEQAAAHIHRFLSLDQTVLKKSAADSKEGSSLDEAFVKLHEAETQLKAIVMRKFDDAVRDEDVASVERFFKIFPLLNQHNEGLKKFSTYLCSQIAEKSQKNMKLAQSLSPSDKRWIVKYADTATLLLEGIARIIEIHQPLIETYYGPGKLFSAIEILQKECDRQFKRILEEFKAQRDFQKKGSLLQQLNKNPYRNLEKLDPRELDILMAEITILSARSQLYLRFIRQKIMGDIEISSADEKWKKEEEARLTRFLKECELSKLIHDVLGTYVTMEEYFMRESIHKAVSMDAIEENSQTSSMLDDVFFIIKKCLRRAVSSSYVDIVCAMLNHTNSLLQTDFYEVLNEKVKLGFPSSMLDFSQAYNVFQASLQMQTSDIDKSKIDFLVTLNNAEVTCDLVRTLRATLEEDVQKMFPHASDQDKRKLDSCLSELTSVNCKFQQLINSGRSHLCVTIVKPRVKPWVDAFQSASHIITEDEFSQYEANDGMRPFIQNFIISIDTFLKSLKSNMTTNNFDALVSLLASELTLQFEKAVLSCHFNRFGGIQFDRELRIIIAYLTTVTTWTIRDKFARLSQIASILNLETVNEILDTWGSNSGSLTWRLTPTEVRQILILRKDFRSEDIKRLKL
ncbi:LOW QUALITY PROTEIN: conserved oligomeric Golgi complex subunit 4-like [Uloborus diversus]|uniref:LOW QUALITY PROTEIN: conserved oligomeric Golgi complex subunit 4-like n=1 Tax=Uloborus diversus TaxID=327109 RepID=UPI002409EA07|nr:LOW QUALITY PROTEIN: conserved oligomeric Golgi complex subunit 4-like [Uloborus diversus]